MDRRATRLKASEDGREETVYKRHWPPASFKSQKLHLGCWKSQEHNRKFNCFMEELTMFLLLIFMEVEGKE